MPEAMMRKLLGKLPPRHDPRTLKLAKYIKSLAPPPNICDLTSKLSSLGMMLNDTLGDCTCAAVGHTIQAWTAYLDRQVILPDSDIEALYEAACGYVPGDPSTDQGGVELNILNYWRQTGIAGHKITAYATLQKKASGVLGRLVGNSSWKHDIMNSVFYFGTAYIGVTLPDAVLGEGIIPWVFPANPDASWQPNPNNGHAVTIVGYNATGPIVITWGTLLQMSWDFADACMDEGYCPFSLDVVGPDGKSPEGFLLAQLQADLNAVTA